MACTKTLVSIGVQASRLKYISTVTLTFSLFRYLEATDLSSIFATQIRENDHLQLIIVTENNPNDLTANHSACQEEFID